MFQFLANIPASISKKMQLKNYKIPKLPTFESEDETTPLSVLESDIESPVSGEYI